MYDYHTNSYRRGNIVSYNYTKKYIPVRLLLPVYISAGNKVESISSTEGGGVDKN